MSRFNVSVCGAVLLVLFDDGEVLGLAAKEALKAMMGFIDVAGLYYALAQLTHINISQNHKFQAVGLGWAFADSVLHRQAPLWVGALGLEFTWDYVLQGPSISTDPAELVKCKSLGSNASKIWVNVSKVDDAKVWRPNSEVNFISDAIGRIQKIVYV